MFEKVGILLLYIIAVVFCKDLLVQVYELHQYIWHIYLVIFIVLPTSLVYFYYQEKKSRLVHYNDDYEVSKKSRLSHKCTDYEVSKDDSINCGEDTKYSSPKDHWQDVPNAAVLSASKRPPAEWGEIIRYKVE